jgi:hypothetical protein
VVLAVLVESLVQVAVTAAAAAAAVALAGLQRRVLLAGPVLQLPVKTPPGVAAGQPLSGQRRLRCSLAMAGLVLQRASLAHLCHMVAAVVVEVRI